MEGAKIYYEIPILGGLPINETMVNTWIMMAFIILLSLYLTSRLERIPKGKQVVAETLVQTFYNLVEQSMGPGKDKYAPYIGTLFMLSLVSSLSSLLTFRPPTADLNTTAAWALITFVMIQYNGLRANGLGKRLKSFAEPSPLLLPINLLGELSTPISMAFRHFGNIFAGMLITSLLLSALASITSFAPSMPAIFQIGIPAILSIYFDLFTSGLQAFIFCMLTMVFVKMAAD
ncbi:MAG: F0F1 ATP synthase subunit A [Clostridia bacterium]